jgi:hypothetical protein
MPKPPVLWLRHGLDAAFLLRAGPDALNDEGDTLRVPDEFTRAAEFDRRAALFYRARVPKQLKQ